MDGLAFVSSLVGSLAWPVVVLVVALIVATKFGDEVRATLGRPARRWKLGPVEAEWEDTAAAARGSLAKSPEAADAPTPTEPPPLRDRLAPMADQSPRAVVLGAYAELEETLRRHATEAGIADAGKLPVRLLLDRMREVGAMSPETSNAVTGLVVLRNLAALGPGDDLSPDRVAEFRVLADATIYSLEAGRRQRSRRPA